MIRKFKKIKSRINRDITPNLTEIKMIVREYYLKTVFDAWHKIDKMDKFLEKGKLSKIAWKEIEKNYIYRKKGVH